MKNYKLELNNNEEMIKDYDDLMETEIVKFKELIKDLKDEDLKYFNNWVKIYKALNYDIFNGLVINKIYKFNSNAAVIELTFRGKKEYDLLYLNPDNMTVSCMNVKDNKVRNYIVRRVLVPQTADDALMFAKSPLPEAAVKSLTKTIKEIETKGKQYEIKLDKNFIITKPDKEEVKEDNKPKVIGIRRRFSEKKEKAEEVKEEVKEEKAEEVKEEVKEEKAEEVNDDIIIVKSGEDKVEITFDNLQNYSTLLNNPYISDKLKIDLLKRGLEQRKAINKIMKY